MVRHPVKKLPPTVGEPRLDTNGPAQRECCRGLIENRWDTALALCIGEPSE